MLDRGRHYFHEGALYLIILDGLLLLLFHDISRTYYTFIAMTAGEEHEARLLFTRFFITKRRALYHRPCHYKRKCHARRPRRMPRRVTSMPQDVRFAAIVFPRPFRHRPSLTMMGAATRCFATRMLFPRRASTGATRPWPLSASLLSGRQPRFGARAMKGRHAADGQADDDKMTSIDAHIAPMMACRPKASAHDRHYFSIGRRCFSYMPRDDAAMLRISLGHAYDGYCWLGQAAKSE